MRKQTKLVAVLSAAALLAMGASMTSFAAGWQKDDDGNWQYFDKDGDMVTDEWQKDGSKWFYLDEDGNMLTDSWVDDTYYVGADGAMIVRDWIKTSTEDSIDDPDDDGEHWYYFDSKGKRVEDTHRKINGKTYYFNEDGEMQYGWYAPNGKEKEVYYLGEEDEGWRRDNQWLWLEAQDEEEPDGDEWDHSIDGCGAGCDEEGWYWFGSDGKMYRDDTKKKTINGKHYFFNADGQMLYEWINTTGKNTNDDVKGNVTTDDVKNALIASRSEIEAETGASMSDADAKQVAGNTVVNGLRYANEVENGSRVGGWREIAGANDAGTDGDTDWYFFKDGKAKKAEMSDLVISGGKMANDDGEKVFRARIKCEGKYFAFNELGQMQDGLQFIDGSMYYFDANGYQKTGKVADVEEEDDDIYAYYFNTKNGGNGKGYNGEKDGYLYWNGKRMEADDDYQLYLVAGDVYLVNTKGKAQKNKKSCDVDEIGEDYTVEINNYKVSKLEPKNSKTEGKTYDLKDRATRETLVKEGKIKVPSIEIYSNVFAPLNAFADNYVGRFYSTGDETDKDSFDYVVSKGYAKDTETTDGADEE